MNQRILKKRRTACDSCHRAKTKCSGGSPCALCLQAGRQCIYSEPSRLGRPKGSKNKKTLRRFQSRDGGNSVHDQVTDRCLGDSHNLPNTTDPDNCRQIQQPEPLTPLSDTFRDGESCSTGAPTGVNENTAISDELSMDLFDVLDDMEALSDDKTEQTSFIPCYQGHELSTNSGEALAIKDYASETAAYSIANAPTADHIQASACVRPRDVENALGNALSPHNSGTSSVPVNCHCLDIQVKLLFRMDEVEQLQKNSTPDVALSAARDAMDHWDTLRHCASCQSGTFEGVFLMFAMSMRFLLRALRCAFSNAGSTGLVQSGTNRTHSAENIASLCSNNFVVSAGAYEATEHEKEAISKILIILAVRRIEAALAYAKRRLQQRRVAAHFEGNKGRAEAIAAFDYLVQEDQRALVTESRFDARMGLLLHGLDGIIGPG